MILGAIASFIGGEIKDAVEAVEKTGRVIEDVLCDGMTPGEAIECENRKDWWK